MRGGFVLLFVLGSCTSSVATWLPLTLAPSPVVSRRPGARRGLARVVASAGSTTKAQKSGGGGGLTVAESNLVASAIARKLPWQATFFMRLFGVSVQDPDDGSDPSGAAATVPSKLQERLKWLFVFWGKAASWMEGHKRTFGMLARASVFAIVGLWVLKRLGSWYKGMAEYEILLDRTDHDYQAYGCNLNGIGGSLLASIDPAAVSRYKHSQLLRRLASALDTPCFPQMMTDYAVQVRVFVVLFPLLILF
jgi:hypothetical protein